MGVANEHSLDHYYWICGGRDSEVPEPSGFIVTALLGIGGAFAATYLGQAVGWYRVGENAGFIGAIVGAIIVLIVWGVIAPRLQRT
jgi:uncharacterized membrane protein YeaQ/YmgE (transglycosylase-associated protein family)